MVSVELTNEEIVTKLLVSNEFIKHDAKNFCVSIPENNLGNYLSETQECSDDIKPFTKYSFIDEGLNWGF